jgi:transcriptional regulator with XRE-family HTH domain
MGRKRRAQPKKLAAKLRKIRSGLGLGQEQMARLLNKVDESVYPGLISRYEHGLAEPSLIVLLEYSRIAGVGMETLADDNVKLPKQ